MRFILIARGISYTRAPMCVIKARSSADGDTSRWWPCRNLIFHSLSKSGRSLFADEIGIFYQGLAEARRIFSYLLSLFGSLFHKHINSQQILIYTKYFSNRNVPTNEMPILWEKTCELT